MKRYITIITLLAAVGCGDANPQAGTGGFGGTAGMGGAAGMGGTGGVGGQGGVRIPANGNPLGTLVECDEVIEEIGGFVKRHKVAVVPVVDPTSVTITRCDSYQSWNGGPREELSGVSGTECDVSGSWIFQEGLAFTPNFEVYVECEVKEFYPEDGEQTYGSERVYIQTNPEPATLPAENPLGVAVECNDVIETTRARYFSDYGTLESVERRKVAYVPVVDPTSVTVTRCHSYYSSNGGPNTPYDTNSECVASMQTESTFDSNAIVECATETTYPVGWSPFNGGEGGVIETGYEYVYVRVDPSESPNEPENPLGVLVECDEVLEWVFAPDTVHETHHRMSVAYLPVADPTSVTLTRCGLYEIRGGERSHSDTCVSSSYVSFTEDFEVYVNCERESTGWNPSTRGYERIYYRTN